MRLGFTLIILLISFSLFAKGDVDYEHKSVFKTLIKSGKLINPTLAELDVPASYQLEGKFFNVNSEADQTKIQHIYIGRVNSCRAGGCSIPNADIGETSEYFDYFICFDKDCNVTMVKVFNYQASHGHEVTAKGWLKQFVGHQADQNLEVGKDIDSISGATISVNGITKDINEKTKILTQILRM